ncbi:MAG: hypothetical protein QM645_00860 [Asticcacaulis sp.]
MPSSASTIGTGTFICPVGNHKFEATVYGSRFIYGQRPDGRPLETSRGYVSPPECPRNHLVLYRDFSSEELTKLGIVIKTAEYRDMVKTETPFYRAAWLEQAINPASADYVWLLLQATWYVNNDAERKERYRALFLSVAEDMPVSTDNIGSLMLRLRVINTYRETGQFDRAARELGKLPVEDLSHGLPDNAEDAYRLSDADLSRWQFVTSANQMKTLILRQDGAVDPIDIIPEWMIEEECYFRQPKSAFESAFCSTPELLQKLADGKDYYEAQRPYYDYDGPILPTPPPPTRKPAISRPR